MSALRTGWVGAWTGVDCVSHFIFSVLDEGRITANGGRARLFLRCKPFLDAASSVKHRAAHTCSWWSYAKRVPTVERALVPPKCSGEFSVVINSARIGTNSDMVISCAPLRAHKSPFREIHVRGIITENLEEFPPLYIEE
jgi:hypothetical protein